ncbi:MAG: hypothetical protein KAX44_01965 [Candidatus Brocadiae bacterium]|nr:hypothetical protein [Candidatus Brocadiia bacterium]
MARTTTRASKARAVPALGRILRALPRIGLAALAVAAVYFAPRWVWRAIVHRPEFHVNPVALSLNGHPEWIDGPSMLRELRKELSALERGQSVFEKDLAHAVQHELRSSPWILDITRVERRLPNKLAIKAVFRKPAGLVAFGEERYLVDKDGHWLPDDLFRRPREWQAESIPLITDQLLDRPPPIGEGWDHPRLSVGARLTEFFLREGLLSELEVNGIDVTGVARDAAEPDIILTVPWRKDDGEVEEAQVKWGKSSVYAQLPELELPPFLVSDSEKLEMLRSKLRDHASLRGIEYVDLRFHGKVFFREGD